MLVAAGLAIMCIYIYIYISGFDNWHTSRTYMRLILLADIMYGYPFGTLKIGFLERRKRKITSHRAESVAN